MHSTIVARKFVKKTAKNTTETTLAVSDLRLGLEFLERENQQLLGKIEKKRTELNNLIDRIRQIGIEIAQRSAPVFQQLLELDRQIHAAFAEIFAKRKLGKQTRKNVESIYANLQFSGVISPREEYEQDKNETEVETDEDRAEWEWGEAHDRTHCYNNDDNLTPKHDRAELQNLRHIFLRLAAVFHPDRVTDPARQEYHTTVMQEINQAYQAGDLAKLLAIEQKHQLGEAIDREDRSDLQRRYQQVEREHQLLQQQFTQLKLELRLTKQTEQGAIAAEYQKLTKAGLDPIGEAVAQTESQVHVVTEIHQLVTDFCDRRITIKDFLKGPSSFQVSEEDLLMELLDLL